MSKSSNAKFANSNLNAVLNKSSSSSGQPASGGLGGAKLGFNGMLVLSKRPRAVAGTKLSVPLPVNLPSMKKEHAGNDPTTQLVPSGPGSGWSAKPPEPEATSTAAAGPSASSAAALSQPQPSLTASSSWATQPKAAAPAASSAWQAPAAPAPPPGRAQPAPGVGPRGFADRQHLNPEEYPSLADTAKGGATAPSKPTKPYEHPQDNHAWADDERAPASVRPYPDWGNGPHGDDRYMDDRGYGPRYDYGRYPGDRAGPMPGRPLDYDGPMYSVPPPPGRHGPEEEALYPRRYGAYPDQPYGGPGPYGRYPDGPAPYRRGPPPPPPAHYEGYMRPYPDAVGYDVGLFPQPPPPRGPPPGARAHAGEDEDDPEARAFQEELARTMADMEKRKEDRSDSVAERRSVAAAEDEAVSLADSSRGGQSESDMVRGSTSRLPGRAGAGGPRAGPGYGEDQDSDRSRRPGADKLRALEQQLAARSAADTALKGSALGGLPAVPPPPPPPPGAPPRPPPRSAWGPPPTAAAPAAREEDSGWDTDERDMAPPPTLLQRSALAAPVSRSDGSPDHLAARDHLATRSPGRHLPEHSLPPPPPPPLPPSGASMQQRPPAPAAAAAAAAAGQSLARPASAGAVTSAALGPAAGSSAPHHHARNTAWQEPGAAKPQAALFGSFDEETLEKLTRGGLAAGGQQEPAAPKPWRPAEGTTPTLLQHAPPSSRLATSSAPASAAQQQQQVQQQQQRAAAGDQAAARQADGAASANGPAAGIMPGPSAADSMQTSAPVRGGRGNRGRGAGRNGRGGGRGAAAGAGEAQAGHTEDGSPSEAPSSRLPSHRSARSGTSDTGAAADAGADAGNPVERGGRGGGRGGRNSGRGGRGGGRGGSAAAAGEPGQEEQAGATADGSQPAGPNKRSRGGASAGKGGRNSSGGRGSGGGRGAGSPESATFAAGAAVAPPPPPPPPSEAHTAAPPPPAGPGSAASATAAGPGPAAPGKASPWAPAGPGAATAAGSVSPLDPVLDPATTSGGKLLLDTAPKPGSSFERSVGSKVAPGAAGKVLGAVGEAASAKAQGVPHAPHAKAPSPAAGSDAGMPQLPADLSLELGPPSGKPSAQAGFQAAPGPRAAGPQPGAGSMLGGAAGAGSSQGLFAAPPHAHLGSGWEAHGAAAALAGFASQPGQSPSAQQFSAAQMAAVAQQFFPPAGLPSSLFNTGAVGSRTAPGAGAAAQPTTPGGHTPLLGYSQFNPAAPFGSAAGGFSTHPFLPPPPNSFNNAGGLGSGMFSSSAAFVPTNKQPDWSTGVPLGGGSQSPSSVPLGGAPRLDALSALPFAGLPTSAATMATDMTGAAGKPTAASGLSLPALPFPSTSMVGATTGGVNPQVVMPALPPSFGQPHLQAGSGTGKPGVGMPGVGAPPLPPPPPTVLSGMGKPLMPPPPPPVGMPGMPYAMNPGAASLAQGAGGGAQLPAPQQVAAGKPHGQARPAGHGPASSALDPSNNLPDELFGGDIKPTPPAPPPPHAGSSSSNGPAAVGGRGRDHAGGHQTSDGRPTGGRGGGQNTNRERGPKGGRGAGPRGPAGGPPPQHPVGNGPAAAAAGGAGQPPPPPQPPSSGNAGPAGSSGGAGRGAGRGGDMGGARGRGFHGSNGRGTGRAGSSGNASGAEAAAGADVAAAAGPLAHGPGRGGGRGGRRGGRGGPGARAASEEGAGAGGHAAGAAAGPAGGRGSGEQNGRGGRGKGGRGPRGGSGERPAGSAQQQAPPAPPPPPGLPPSAAAK